MTHLPYDPLEGAEIMSLIGFDPARLTIPRIAAQVREVVTFFSNKADRRYHILKIMSKPGDKLDNLWTYVQLQKEKASKLQELNPEDFDTDVAEEIVTGHLTIDKKTRIRADLQKHKQEAERKELERQLKQQDAKDQKQIQEALPKSKLDLYEQAINELDRIDSQLEIYE